MKVQLIIRLMRLKKYSTAILSIFFLLTALPAWGGGLTVEPGGLLIQQVSIGETYDLYSGTGISLKVYNRLDRPAAYRVSTHKPSAAGINRWVQGYMEIPDSSWLYFDKNEIYIEPQGMGEVKLYLKVPADGGYYNQHWAVTVSVEGVATPGDAFAMAAYLPFEIETESREKTEMRPWGEIGVAPSILTLQAGENGKVKIYNSDDRDHNYRIRAGVPPATSAVRRPGMTPGYSEIPEVSWLGISHKDISIRQGRVMEISVRPHIPDKLASHGPWEAILWVESDDGDSAFARINLE